MTLDWKNAETRVRHLDFAFAVLKQWQDVLIMGDMNFDDLAEPETSHIRTDYVDVWPSLRPRQMGYTWDPTTNAYARFSDEKSAPSRIDRVFIKSKEWLPRTIKLVGCAYDILCNRNSSNSNLKEVVASTSKGGLASFSLLEQSAQLGQATETETDAPRRAAATTPDEGLGSKALPIIMAADGSDAEMHYPSNHYGLFLQLSRFTPHC